MEDVIDLAVAFSCPVVPPGNKIALLIEAGGGAVASSDAAAKEGLEIPRLSEEVQNKLTEYLKDRVPPSANRKNPVDLVWVNPGDPYGVYIDCLELVLPEVDVCLVIAYGFIQEEHFRRRIMELRDRFKKPVVYIPGNPADQMNGMSMATMDGIPTYVMPENAIRSIGAMVRRGEYLKKIRPPGH
jgi:acyl-CoA synthetase (NDP forming)